MARFAPTGLPYEDGCDPGGRGRVVTKDSTAKTPTLGDVARLANVSVPTASRVLNGGVRGDVSGSVELRERVQSAADALGYAPNPAAQTIKGGRSKSVALLVGDIEDSGSATMIAGVMRAAQQHGLSVAVRMTEDKAHREHSVLKALRGERHSAIIVATSRTTDMEQETAIARDLDVLAHQGARIVVIGDSSLPFPRVTIDTARASAKFARALVGADAQRYGIIAGPENQITSRNRVAGFLDGLATCGIVPESVPVVHQEFSRDGGYHGFEELLDTCETLDVVATMSDAMAVGAIVRARELGTRVPSGLEITGFDGISVISDLVPTLSTVAVPLEVFGETALSLALDDTASSVETVTLKARLIVRGHTIII